MRFRVLFAVAGVLSIGLGRAAAQPAGQTPPASGGPNAAAASQPAGQTHVVPMDGGGRVKLVELTPTPAPGAASPVSGAWYVVDEPFFGFGQVWQNENVTHSFEIRNTSKDQVLEILEVKADCHCTTPGDYERRIEPGQTGYIMFTLHTAGLGNQLTKGAMVRTNDPQRPEFRVTMQGFCKTLVTLTPNSGGSFGEIIAASDERVSEMVMTSNVPEPLKLVLEPIHGKPPFKLEMAEVVEGKQWKFTLRTVPPLPTGNQSYPFRIRTGHEKIPFLPLVASYFRPERVAARPINLRFPDVIEGGQNNPGIDIINHGDTPVRVLSAETPDEPQFKVSVIPKADGALYTIEIKAPIGYRLEGALDLIIKTDDPEYAEIKIPVWSLASRGKEHPTARNRRLRELASARARASTQPASTQPAGAPGSKYQLRGKPTGADDAPPPADATTAGDASGAPKPAENPNPAK